LAVHGALDRAGSFTRLSRRLEDFDLVAFDRRGYQRSRDISPLSFTDHVNDVIHVTEFLAERGPILLVGHSYGGTVAIGAAVAAPERVCGVVAYESPLPWVHARAHSRPVGDDVGAEVEAFFRRAVGNRIWERLSSDEKESRRLDGPSLLEDLRSLRRGEELVDVTALRVPTLYLYGTGPIEEYYATLAEKLRASNSVITTGVIDGANHGAHLSHPSELGQFVRDFWEERCASA
jgi:pimeloyl-ACP methyl ester carboxylesterase